MPQAKKPNFYLCSALELPDEDQLAAARHAVEVNPANAPDAVGVSRLFDLESVRDLVGDCVENLLDEVSQPQRLAFLTSKYWGNKGVRLSVSFLESQSQAFITKVLAYANRWGEFCNVKFEWSQSGGRVRITTAGDGYWSYLGTDIDRISSGQPTMCLQGFTANTGDAEYKRVVCHEFGHTLGCPHEHMRREIVNRLDPAKTVALFRRTQGWSEATTRSQVLTPLEERSILGSPVTDDSSIMTYMLPASITRDGKPIPGGADFSATDKEWAGKQYPVAVQPPPTAGDVLATIRVYKDGRVEKVA